MTARSARGTELGLIHIGAESLGMDTRDKDPDTEYRSMLWSIGRVRSAADLDATGRQAVLQHLKSRGFKPTGRKRRKATPKARLIHHIWNCLADSQVVEHRSALKAWLVNQTKHRDPRGFGWERPEFLPADVASAVIEQLKQWAARTNVDWR